MGRHLINETTLTDLADLIRYKTNTTEDLSLEDMKNVIYRDLDVYDHNPLKYKVIASPYNEALSVNRLPITVDRIEYDSNNNFVEWSINKDKTFTSTVFKKTHSTNGAAHSITVCDDFYLEADHQYAFVILRTAGDNTISSAQAHLYFGDTEQFTIYSSTPGSNTSNSITFMPTKSGSYSLQLSVRWSSDVKAGESATFGICMGSNANLSSYVVPIWKNDLIWVATDVNIGECQISNKTPTTRGDGTELQEGDVWIKTCDYSTLEYNLLRQGCLPVYLASAWQWIDSTWVYKDMRISIDNDWVTPGIEALSSNINLLGDSVKLHTLQGAANITVMDGNIIQLDVSDSFVGFVQFKNAIDITNYSQIYITLNEMDLSFRNCQYTIGNKTTTYSGGIEFGFNSTSELEIPYTPDMGYTNMANTYDVNSTIFKVDVAQYKGPGYLTLGVIGATGSVKISRIWCI